MYGDQIRLPMCRWHTGRCHGAARALKGSFEDAALRARECAVGAARFIRPGPGPDVVAPGAILEAGLPRRGQALSSAGHAGQS
jgi:hypothetical protein